MFSSEAANPVVLARRAFFERGDEPRGLVPDDILASWERCRKLGLEAGRVPHTGPVAAHALREARERYERLRRISRPELESLYASVNRARSIVILTAPDGLILDALGNAEFLDKAARVALCPGSRWSESVIGTNGIGTALVEGRSVEVHGGEHYCRLHRILNCSATPIFSPQGKIIGVLDLSSEAAMHHALALGMVQYAAEQIECRLFELEFSASDIVRVDVNPELVGTARCGLIVFRGQCLYAANRRALRLLGLQPQDIGKLDYGNLFAAALPQPGETRAVSHSDNITMYVRRGDTDRPRIFRAPASMPRPRPRPHAPQAVFTSVLEARIARATRLLDARLPVLLQGETGTGKEIVAREIHQRSARAEAPFVTVNCTALPEGLIESELFGYAPGAFTGARREGSKGLLRQADGGTLFLDEIGDMPVELQCRLLRVLQEREVAPLGSSSTAAVDFNLISATHQPLAQRVEAGTFRADLYYRIAQSVICLPALREYEDRPAIIERLWETLGAADANLRLDPALLAALAARRWPGNLRQLVSVLQNLIALGNPDSTLTVADLPHGPEPWAAETPATSTRSTSYAPTQPTLGDLQAIQQHAIDEALDHCQGNVAAAARQLGINRSTIYRRLKQRSGGNTE